MEAKLHPTVAQIFTESLSLIDLALSAVAPSRGKRIARLQSYDDILTIQSRFAHTGDYRDSLEHEEKCDTTRCNRVRNFEKNARNIRLISRNSWKLISENYSRRSELFKYLGTQEEGLLSENFIVAITR